MSAHINHLSDWLEQLNTAGVRFCREMQPMDAMLIGALARNIERAACDYLSKFNLRDVVPDDSKRRNEA